MRNSRSLTQRFKGADTSAQFSSVKGKVSKVKLLPPAAPLWCEMKITKPEESLPGGCKRFYTGNGIYGLKEPYRPALPVRPIITFPFLQPLRLGRAQDSRTSSHNYPRNKITLSCTSYSFSWTDETLQETECAGPLSQVLKWGQLLFGRNTGWATTQSYRLGQPLLSLPKPSITSFHYFLPLLFLYMRCLYMTLSGTFVGWYCPLTLHQKGTQVRF